MIYPIRAGGRRAPMVLSFFVPTLVAAGAGMAQGHHVWSIALLAVAVTVALQIGYLLGTGIRSLLAAGRASRVYGTSVPSPAVVRRSVR